MIPQPPPDAPAPPPSEAAILSRKKWKWLWVVGLISMVIITLLLSPFFIGHRHHHHGASESVNNARQIGMALFEFEAEYGKFPDATTINAVREATETLLPLGTKTSNDYFRQLIGSGIAQSEPMFYAKIKGTHKPDGRTDSADALAKGEVGFTYLAGLSAEGNPSRPLVVAPMIPGTDRFDSTAFEGKAILLKMDNSVTSAPIQKDGHVLVNGKNLFDPTNPIWEGKPPVIVWPDL